jgi:hypothetical protein
VFVDERLTTREYHLSGTQLRGFIEDSDNGLDREATRLFSVRTRAAVYTRQRAALSEFDLDFCEP